MECDELGNVWVTGPGGVWVLTPDGERIGIVETPEVCGSICWGDGAESEHPVPDDDDDGAHDPDDRRARAASAVLGT